MADFILIAKTQPEWDTFLPGAAAVLGRSITASLDEHGTPDRVGLAAFGCVLSEFCHPGRRPETALREDVLVLRHIHLAFLVAASREVIFKMSACGLYVTLASNGDAAIVSGNLIDWVRTIIECLNPACEPVLKKLCCSLVVWFERNDLGDIFYNKRKVHTPDRLFHYV